MTYIGEPMWCVSVPEPRPPIPLQEAKMACFSALIAKLSAKYAKTIEDEEHPREAMARTGYTDVELGARRRKAHNDLMDALAKEGYVFKDRGEVTEWNNKFQMWMRDEE